MSRRSKELELSKFFQKSKVDARKANQLHRWNSPVLSYREINGCQTLGTVRCQHRYGTSNELSLRWNSVEL